MSHDPSKLEKELTEIRGRISRNEERLDSQRLIPEQQAVIRQTIAADHRREKELVDFLSIGRTVTASAA